MGSPGAPSPCSQTSSTNLAGQGRGVPGGAAGRCHRSQVGKGSATGVIRSSHETAGHRAGVYWPVNYTRRMKSRTEYLRRECVKELRRQIVTHRGFKRLVDQWIGLGIGHSRLTMRIAEPKASIAGGLSRRSAHSGCPR